jgi:serine/threonine protein kinase
MHPQGYTCSEQAEVNHFTSLEEYRGQVLTSSTDLWDVGVLIYFICKGKYINFTTFK